jgi:hypothetical protein
MQTLDKVAISTPRRRMIWIALGVAIILAAMAGLWFSTQYSRRP